MNDCKSKYCGGGLRLCCLQCKTRDVCPEPCPGDYSCRWAELTPSERYRAWYNTRMAIIGILLAIWVVGSLMLIMWMIDETNHKIETIQIIKQTIEPTTEVTEENQGLTQEEFDLVCRVVSAESRGESLQGMMAVAQTIFDRSTEWGLTPTEVVLAEGQYAEPYQGEISDEVRLAVANVWNGCRVFEESTTHFASNDPYWAESKVNRGTIGRHTFYGGDRE